MTPTFKKSLGKKTPDMVTRAFKGTLLAGAMTGLLAGLMVSAMPALAQDAPAPVVPMDGPIAGHKGMGPGVGPGMGRMGGWPGFDLKRFDTNGDGKVTMEELTQKRQADVTALDANGDGKLSEEEMVNAEIARIRPMIEARVKARIAAQDADGDGQLSAAELMVPAVPERMFERADADHDGAVTAEEFQAAHRKMMEHMRDKGGPGRGPDRGPGWGAMKHPHPQGHPMPPADQAQPREPGAKPAQP